MSSLDGKPLTARTDTDAGRASPSWLVALAVISSAAWRILSSTAGSWARTTGWPLHGLAGTVLTVMTVTAACCTAACLTAHSSARAEWADPSIPTMTPGIVLPPSDRAAAPGRRGSYVHAPFVRPPPPGTLDGRSDAFRPVLQPASGPGGDRPRAGVGFSHSARS